MTTFTPTNHLEDCINQIKQKPHPYSTNYKNALANSLACSDDHTGVISVPSKLDVQHVRDIKLRLDVNDLYETLLEYKIILSTNMCLEYIAFLSNISAEKLSPKFIPNIRRKVNKNRYADFFGDYPTVGRKNENLYTYGALFVLCGLNEDVMPHIDLNNLRYGH